MAKNQWIVSTFALLIILVGTVLFVEAAENPSKKSTLLFPGQPGPDLTIENATINCVQSQIIPAIPSGQPGQISVWFLDKNGNHLYTSVTDASNNNTHFHTEIVNILNTANAMNKTVTLHTDKNSKIDEAQLGTPLLNSRQPEKGQYFNATINAVSSQIIPSSQTGKTSVYLTNESGNNLTTNVTDATNNNAYFHTEIVNNLITANAMNKTVNLHADRDSKIDVAQLGTVL